MSEKSANIIQSIGDSAASAAEFSGEVVNDFVNTVLHTVGGVVDGASIITDATSNILDMVVHDVVGIKTMQVFKGAGDISHKVSEKLGDVVDSVPLLGGPVAYIVRRAGDAVYHVVVSVGTVVESATRRVGAAATKTTDLLVFTLTAAKDELMEIGDDVTDAVSVLTRRQRKSSSKAIREAASRLEAHGKRRSARKSGGGRRRRASRKAAAKQQVGGGRLPSEFYGRNSGTYTAANYQQPAQTAYGESVPTSHGESITSALFRGPNLAPGGTYLTNTSSGIQTGGDGGDVNMYNLIKENITASQTNSTQSINEFIQTKNFRQYMKSIHPDDYAPSSLANDLECRIDANIKRHTEGLNVNRVIADSALEIIRAILENKAINMQDLYENFCESHKRNATEDFEATQKEICGICERAVADIAPFKTWKFDAINNRINKFKQNAYEADIWYGIKLQVQHDVILKKIRTAGSSSLKRDLVSLARFYNNGQSIVGELNNLPRIPYIFTLLNIVYSPDMQPSDLIKKVTQLMLLKQFSLIERLSKHFTSQLSSSANVPADNTVAICALLKPENKPKTDTEGNNLSGSEASDDAVDESGDTDGPNGNEDEDEDEDEDEAADAEAADAEAADAEAADAEAADAEAAEDEADEEEEEEAEEDEEEEEEAEEDEEEEEEEEEEEQEEAAKKAATKAATKADTKNNTKKTKKSKKK
jgi:hypothetical protein